MKRNILVISVLASVLAVQGCAYRSYANDVYTDADAQRAHTIVLATVTHVRWVTIERGMSGSGAGAGSSIGAVLGGRIGSNNGSFDGSILGAIAGGFAGQGLEANLSKARALEISLRCDDGQTIAVVQDPQDLFKRGDRVQVLTAEGKSRVTRSSPIF